MEGQQQQQPSNLEQQMIEAATDFKEQFDPKNPNYHGGIQTQVPTGGQRIPESMQGQMYPTNVENTDQYINQQQAQPQDFGPEYEKVVQERQQFLSFKKQLANMCKFQETILRQREVYNKKKDGSEKDQVLLENIKAEQLKLKDLINKELLPLIEVLEASDFKDRYVGVRDMIDQAENEFKDKSELGNWFLNYKKFGQYSFNDASALMQKMKKIKKEYQDNQKQAEQNPEEAKKDN